MGKIIAILFILIGFNTFAQAYPGNKKFRIRSGQYRQKNILNFRHGRFTRRLELQGHFGISFGQEALIGLPKLGGICKFKFKRRSNSYNRPFNGNCFYVGPEVSIIVLFGAAFNAGVQAGFKLGPITIDNSISRLVLSNPSGDIVAKQNSYNPKIGVVLGPVWLKFGPSFVTKGDNILGDGIGMQNFPYNAEVLFIGKF